MDRLLLEGEMGEGRSLVLIVLSRMRRARSIVMFVDYRSLGSWFACNPDIGTNVMDG